MKRKNLIATVSALALAAGAVGLALVPAQAHDHDYTYVTAADCRAADKALAAGKPLPNHQKWYMSQSSLVNDNILEIYLNGTQYERAVRDAAQIWMDSTNHAVDIRFVDQPTANSVKIVDDPNMTNAAGYNQFNPNIISFNASVLRMDNEENYVKGARAVALHEIGHAMGLAHGCLGHLMSNGGTFAKPQSSLPTAMDIAALVQNLRVPYYDSPSPAEPTPPVEPTQPVEPTPTETETETPTPSEPTAEPSTEPSEEPSEEPSTEPSTETTTEPTTQPTAQPTEPPTPTETPEPSPTAPETPSTSESAESVVPQWPVINKTRCGRTSWILPSTEGLSYSSTLSPDMSTLTVQVTPLSGFQIAAGNPAVKSFDVTPTRCETIPTPATPVTPEPTTPAPVTPSPSESPEQPVITPTADPIPSVVTPVLRDAIPQAPVVNKSVCNRARWTISATEGISYQWRYSADYTKLLVTATPLDGYRIKPGATSEFEADVVPVPCRATQPATTLAQGVQTRARAALTQGVQPSVTATPTQGVSTRQSAAQDQDAQPKEQATLSQTVAPTPTQAEVSPQETKQQETKQTAWDRVTAWLRALFGIR